MFALSVLEEALGTFLYIYVDEFLWFNDGYVLLILSICATWKLHCTMCELLNCMPVYTISKGAFIFRMSILNAVIATVTNEEH